MTKKRPMRIREPNNQSLSRPRSERPYEKTACTSVGISWGSSQNSGGDHMYMLSKKHPNDLWGAKK